MPSPINIYLDHIFTIPDRNRSETLRNVDYFFLMETAKQNKVFPLCTDDFLNVIN